MTDAVSMIEDLPMIDFKEGIEKVIASKYAKSFGKNRLILADKYKLSASWVTGKAAV